MKKPFTSTDPASGQGENIWFTPPEIVKPLGHFDIDVCTVSFRPFDIAKKHIEFDKGQNAFKEEWGGIVWMNPPYGKEIDPFIERFMKIENGIALVFARMGTHWIQKFLKEENEIFLLRKRIAFISKEGIKGTGAGADSCFLIRGQEAKIKIEFSGLEGVFIKGIK